jgi:hypothetical protein
MSSTSSVIILFIVSILSLFLLFAKPRLATWSLIVLCVFDLGFASRWLGTPRILARLPVIIALVLGARMVSDFLLCPQLKMTGSRILYATNYLLLCFFFLFLMSNLYNGENLVLGIYELRYYVIFTILVYSIYFYIPVPSSFRSFVLPVIVIALIQLPFTILQNLSVTYGNLRLSASALDIVSGTFVSYQPLIFCQTMAIGLLLTYQLHEKKPLLRINNYFLTIIIIIPLLISYSRTAVVFVLFTIFISYLSYALQERNLMIFFKTVAIMVVFPCCLLVLFYFFFWKKNDFLYQLDIDYIIEYFFRDPLTSYTPGIDVHPVMGRGKAVVEAFLLILSDFFTFIVGCGAGAVSKSDFLGIKGTYYQSYGPLAGVGRTQFAKNTCEFGLLGSVFLLTYCFSIFKFINNSLCRNDLSHADRVIIVIVSAIIPLYFYTKITTFNIVLLLLAYSIVYIHHSIEEITTETDTNVL